jgi:hypothetical protein
VDERQQEAELEKFRRALLRILHYPVPRIAGSTSPVIALAMMRDALVQVQIIARDALK